MCNTLELGVRTIFGMIIGDPLTGLQDYRIFAWYVISNKSKGMEVLLLYLTEIEILLLIIGSSCGSQLFDWDMLWK